MCGIVYVKNFNGQVANTAVIQKYKNQRSRGTNGFGFYIPADNQLVHNTREGRILQLLKRYKSDEILFHHRFPTSTLNVRNSCHPFSTKDVFKNNYITVHNGIVSNSDELQKKHQKLGINYISASADAEFPELIDFNDSEALAYDIALYLEGKQKKLHAKGSIAFVTVKRDKTGKPVALYFGRNTQSPLHLRATKNFISLASEGKGVMIQPDTLYRFDYKTKELTDSPLKIPEYQSYTYYSNSYQYQSSYENSSYENEMGFGATQLEDSDLTELEPTSVKGMKEALMEQANYSIADAIETGYDKLIELDGQLNELGETEADQVNTNLAIALIDKINLLDNVVKSLEGDLLIPAKGAKNASK